MKKEKKYYVFKMRGIFLQVLSTILLLGMFLITAFLYQTYNITEYSYLIVYFLLFPYFFLHELVHALFYYLNGAKKENITFGVHLEKGVFCCLVKENVSKKNILMSLISPFLFLGVIPYIVGIISENIVITFLALLNIAGCSGDLIMFIDFLKLKDFEYSEFDNPVAFGLYSKEDLSQRKLIGLKYVKTTSNLEIKDFEKITISKTSWWFMLIYYLFGFLFLLYI